MNVEVKERSAKGEAKNKQYEPAAYEDAILGFRNHWYPAMFSADVRETEVKTLKILGEDLLLKRVDGRVYAVRDECLHRGFKLSAKPECFTSNTITCWFHGFTYSLKDGRLVGIPSDPESKLIGKLKLHSYPVEEKKGMLFVFIGDIDPPPLANDVQFGFLDDDMHMVPFHNEEVHSNWRIAADSASEFNHTFIHKDDGLIKYWKQPLAFAESPKSDNPYEGYILHEGPGPKGFTDAFCDVIPVMEFKIECDGEVGVVRPLYNPAEHSGSVPILDVSASLFLPCGLRIGPWGSEPGAVTQTPSYMHYEWYVPIDETHHRYIIAWGRKVSSEGEALEAEHDVRTRWSYLEYEGFNQSDILANEGSQRAYEEEGYAFGEKENLSRIDAYVLTWRRLAAKHNRGLQRRYGGKK